MDSYETSTAIHFIIFAITFTAAFGFAAWRIVRNLEKEDEVTTKVVNESNDQKTNSIENTENEE